MSNASANLKKAFKPGAKGRTGYMVAVVGFVVLAGVGFVMISKSHATPDVATTVAPMPQMQSIPGASTSTDAYLQTQRQSNQQQAQAAAAAGQSSIPTIDSKFTKVNDPSNPQGPQQQQPQPQQFVMPAPQQQQPQQQQADSGASKQSQILLALWAPPKTEVIDGGMKKEAAAPAQVATVQPAAVQAGKPAASSTAPAKVLIHAGKLLFATLDNSLNTDQPGPVIATVAEGPFKGAKLLGEMTAAKDAIGLKFNKMAFNDQTYSVNACGLDQQSTASALASDVDHHYFAKYGAIFMGALLGGYGDAASRGDQSITQSATGAVITQSPLSPSLRTMVALGKAGSAVGTAMGNVASQIQTTVKVPYGTAIGVQFLADVTTK